MELSELELANLIKDQVTASIQPYLAIKRPEGEPGVENKLFPTFGDFVKSVLLKDAKLMEYRTKTLSMDSDPSGGYLVPEEFAPGLKQIMSEGGIVRPRATVIPAGSPSPDAEINIPVLNQSGAASKDMFAGLWFQWTNEGGAKPEKEIAFDMVKLAPQEYSAMTILTDKIIRNAGALEGYVKAVYSRAQIAFEDYYFLRGNGVNGPLGVINSPAYIQAARTGGGAIIFADILLILAQLMPGCNPIWVISRSAYGQIAGLVDAGNHSIFITGDATKAMPDRLMGYPVYWSFRVPALGAVGDISLCDFSYYLIKDGFGPAFDTSKHVYFTSNKTVLKMFSNVDGQPWLNGTITAEDDATEISPFVGLTV